MPVIKIENFGGEMPSMSARALPPNAAQENRNLLLGTAEFRPQMVDLAAGSVTAGAQTLRRFNNTWRTSTTVQSYVKGQINDEKTERTYFTEDSGSAAPRAIDNTGANRELGVYRPVKPAVTLAVADELTQQEANTYLYEKGAELIRAALAANFETGEPAARFGTLPVAGPYSKHGMEYASETGLFPAGSAGAVEHWNLYARITSERFAALKLDGLRLNSRFTGAALTGPRFLPLSALPFAYVPKADAMSAAIRLIQVPAGSSRAGSQLLTDAQIAKLVAAVTDYMNPSKFAKDKRDELDGLAKEFYRLLTSTEVTVLTEPTKESFTYTDSTVVPPVTRNVTQKPTGPQYDVVWRDTTEAGGGSESVYSPTWRAYEAALEQYNKAKATYDKGVSDSTFTADSLNARLAEIQAKAAVLSKDIETETVSRLNALTADVKFVADFLARQGGVSEFLGTITERIVDTRFYVVTFVTDWGEESAPSEPSDMLEMDQNDVPTITRPNSTRVGSALAGASIATWRLYRSNTGTQTAAFQFVDEMPIATLSYADSKKAEQLGEVCPTLTWEPPPYRADMQSSNYPRPVVGTNPYLRGLVGMPNGIMAGFFDNTLAFCEPYVPYAWPVEYQITTEFPIVGLGVFGQTLFVGTTGNPYFVSGADSASMSAQKLDAQQSCASARSIAPVQGGVLFASPDGLCAADPSGVKVVSDGVFAREDWQKLNPSTMFAASHENIYYLWYSGQGGGCLTFDLTSKKLGRIDLPATSAFTDMLTDTLYVANGSALSAVFGGTTRRTGKWKSGRLTLPQQTPMAWVAVHGEQSVVDPVTVRWYGDGLLRHTASFTNLSPQRLPPGRWLEHEIEVESRARVTRVVVAGNTQELQSA